MWDEFRVDRRRCWAVTKTVLASVGRLPSEASELLWPPSPPSRGTTVMVGDGAFASLSSKKSRPSPTSAQSSLHHASCNTQFVVEEGGAQEKRAAYAATAGQVVDILTDQCQFLNLIGRMVRDSSCVGLPFLSMFPRLAFLC